jgi:hypothetical protein
VAVGEEIETSLQEIAIATKLLGLINLKEAQAARFEPLLLFLTSIHEGGAIAPSQSKLMMG